MGAQPGDAADAGYVQAILDSVQTGIAIVDGETHEILDVNRAAGEMIGAAREAIVGRACHEFICPCAAGRCPITDLGQTVDKSERVLITAGGEQVPVLKTVAWATLRGRACLVESFVDISERQRAEVALRESRERHRALFQQIQAAVVVHSADTRIKLCNAAAQGLLGMTEDQMLGRTAIDPAWQFLREDGTAMPVPEFPVNRVLSTAQPLRDSVVGVRRPDRSAPVWVLVNANPVFDRGEIGEVVVSFMDITERREVNRELVRHREHLEELVAARTAALARSEQRFRAMIANFPETLYVADPGTYEVLFVSRVLEEALGSDLVGQKCYRAFQGFEAPCDFCTNEIILGERVPYTWEYFNPMLERAYLITDQIIAWPDGRDVRFEVAIEITERKRAEKELAARLEELERFHRLAVGREKRMVALKQEVNALSRRLGEEPPYDLSFLA